jgi:hypothetical protein
MTLYNCLWCANLEKHENQRPTCPAFPEGIPLEKMRESDEESQKKPCKGNIKYKPLDED